MCFRPSPVKQNDYSDQVCCQTCGMPVAPDTDTCPYCGDPIPADSSNEFGDIDPSYSVRII